jgi:hypothetical protein
VGPVKPGAEKSGFVFSTLDEGLKNLDINFLAVDQVYEFIFSLPVPGLALGPLDAKAVVTLGGNAVVNGATTPIDFGGVTQGDVGPTRTFTVTNSGTDTLTVGAVTLPAGFTLVDPLVGPLSPGASESFTVQVDTSSSGVKSGVVSFANSDPAQNPFTFAITATVNDAICETPVALAGGRRRRKRLRLGLSLLLLIETTVAKIREIDASLYDRP